MAVPISKCSLNSVLQSILSVANEEQNAILPPSVYSSMYNTVTSLLISALVRAYPDDSTIIDCLRPFVSVVKLPVQKGFITLPDDYRDLLGNPSVNINPKGTGECEAMPITTDQQFSIANQKGGCQLRPVIILPKSEFDYRTTSTYNYPTYNDPIGMFYGNNQIKVCPFDLTKVELMYVKKEPTFLYGYVTNPDDTYSFDVSTTIESVWGSEAFDKIFPAMMALYSGYTRDRELSDWTRILHEQGIL